jgi:predicted peptidase
VGGTEGGSAQAGGGGAAGGAGQAAGGEAGAYVPISFGTTLEPSAQIAESKQLAQSLAKPGSATWRAKGDQRRTYRFAAANADVPFRVCVPTDWDGTSKLPLVMFLHGASNDESSYLDQNDKQMVTLANQHGYVLVSPLGYNGAYGNFLRLPADFSKPDEAAKMLAARTEQTEKTQELSEKDVINVLEIVLNEYPIDSTKMFLTGHSMGSGGTWYIGGKYATYWAALAPMSGPFVLEIGYPWEHLRTKPVFVTEGLSAATVAGSHAVRDWMRTQGYPVTYEEVNADHPGMVPLVLPDVFAFFDQVK